MKPDAEARWARAVRVLAVAAALLLVIAVLEVRALRRARGEIQQLRGERDDTALVADVFGVFLPARAAGTSMNASLAQMKDAIVRSEPYRAVHPDRAPPSRGPGGR